MSYADCIRQNPALSDARKERLVNEYNKLVMAYTKTMGDINAVHAAARKILSIEEEQIKKRMENTVRDVLAWQQLNAKIDDYKTGIDAEKADTIKGMKWLWGNSTTRAVYRVLENTYMRGAAIENRAHRALSESIERYRSKAAGLKQDTEGFNKVVDELLGKDTGDAGAKAEARGIREVFDMLHKLYTNAGGIMGKLDNYFPQSHNSFRISKTDINEWKGFIKPLLDREKMVNEQTGFPYTDAELDKALDGVYDNIITNGLNDLAERVELGKQNAGRPRSVALRHGASRFLHFKNADSFNSYNNRFGNGEEGLFGAMMGHIHAMSRDIGLLQELGPNPDAQLQRMKMKMRVDKASPNSIETMDKMYRIAAGRTGHSGVNDLWYRFGEGMQNWLRSAYLGGAPVAALTDSFYAVMAAKYNGLPAGKVLRNYVGMLNPLDDSDRMIARRNAFASNAASGMSLKQARYFDDVSTGGGKVLQATRFMANFTNRASGLGVMTDAVSSAPVLATQGFFASAASKGFSWNELPDAMKEAFARWDMNEADYRNIIASKPFIEPEYGGDFIRPEEVMLAGFTDTARKYELWLTDMSSLASNEPRLLTRAITTGGFQQGTWERLGRSSLMMFKSFGITVMLNHTIPALRAAGQGRMGRLAPMLFVLPLLGAMAMQSRDVLYGKQPQDMDSVSFWSASFLQGGGFGIFGDFLFNDFSRFNQDFITTFAGPMAGAANDFVRVFKGSFDRTLNESEQKDRFFADLYQLAERNIPMVKLWYTRLILERLLLDQAERAIDPTFDKRIRRMERRMQEEKGQQYWIRPGELEVNQ